MTKLEITINKDGAGLNMSIAVIPASSTNNDEYGMARAISEALEQAVNQMAGGKASGNYTEVVLEGKAAEKAHEAMNGVKP